jgi:hypothetical protein
VGKYLGSYLDSDNLSHILVKVFLERFKLIYDYSQNRDHEQFIPFYTKLTNVEKKIFQKHREFNQVFVQWTNRRANKIQVSEHIQSEPKKLHIHKQN